MTPCCRLCGEPLDDGRSWQPDLFGDGGAHFDCLEAAQDEQEDDA